MISPGMLKQVVTVSRPSSEVQNSIGETTTTFAAVYSSIPGSVQPRKNSTKQIIAGRIANGNFVCYLRASEAASVQNGDRVNDGAEDYQVVAADDAAGRGAVWQLGCDLDRRSA